MPGQTGIGGEKKHVLLVKGEGHVGDVAVVSLPEQTVVKASALAYLLPLAGLFIGMLLGALVAPQSETAGSAIGGVIGLAAALIGAAAYGVWTNGQNFTDAAYLQSLWANVYLWTAVLAILGNARHYLNRETPVSRFFTQRSYALYVVHYPVLLLTALLLTERTTLPAALMYLLTLVIGFGATLGLSEVICRIPGIRYLVLGIRKEKKA